jgi:hypothetical protein
VKSHEDRHFEAGIIAAGVIAVVIVLAAVYAKLWCPPWLAPLGLFVVSFGSVALLWREMRPVFNHWRYLAKHGEKPLEWEHRWRGALMWMGARLGSRHYLDRPMMADPTTTNVLWRGAGFLAITVGTVMQIIAVWPSAPCP